MAKAGGLCWLALLAALHGGRAGAAHLPPPKPTPARPPGPPEGPREAACVNALERLMGDDRNHVQLSIATDASSRPSLESLAAQPLYGGGGLGNFDECSAQPGLHYCLAGSVGGTKNVFTFGGVCVPEECSAEMLGDGKGPYVQWLRDNSQDLWQRLRRPPGAAAAAAAGDAGDAGDAGGRVPLNDFTRVAYIQLLNATAEVGAYLGTGYTCGSYSVPMGRASAALLVILAALLARLVKGTVRHLPGQRAGAKPSAAAAGAPTALTTAAAAAGPREEGLWPALLASFNCAPHIERLFAPGGSPELRCLDGVRVFSMLWVVLGHTLAVQSAIGFSNPEDLLPPAGALASVLGQLFFAARFSVDTFFFVSGFLVVHALLKRLRAPADGGGGRHEASGAFALRYSRAAPYLALHRFVRITPPYMACLLFWWKVAPLLGQGPMWFHWGEYTRLCDRLWWTNLLYVNNLVPWLHAETDGCFYHSWYLADDMQLFLLAPLFVFWYRQHPRAAVAATAAAALLSVAATAALAYAHGWSVNTFDGVAVTRYSEEGYTKPHVRAQAYFAGMLLGMLVDRHGAAWRGAAAGGRAATRGLMAAAAVLLAGVTFGTYGAYERRPCLYEESPREDDCGSTWGAELTFLYAAFSKAAWAVGVALLVGLCVTGRGGLADAFLSHGAFAPLARLSFGAYLIHPIVINAWYLSYTEKVRYSALTFAMSYISICVVTFAAALILALIVEFPLVALSRRFLRPPAPGTPKMDADLSSLVPSEQSRVGRLLRTHANAPLRERRYGATAEEEGRRLLWETKEGAEAAPERC